LRAISDRYVLIRPPAWFHDIDHTDGVRYRQREEQLIREFTTSANKPWSTEVKPVFEASSDS